MAGQDQDKARTPLPYHLYMPPRPRRPLLVLVHGVSSRPARLIDYAAAFAAQHGVPLLAPDFSGAEFAGYQRLRGRQGGLGPARALQTAVDEVGVRYGLETDRFDLMGFSGGAQFAHRFALHFPRAVRRVVVAAAGWYTYLDRDFAYPLGVGEGEMSPSDPALEAFLRLPILVAVGEKDVERGERFRTTPELDRRQGAHRFERARRWIDHLSNEAMKRGVADQLEFLSLPNTGHSLKEAVRNGGLIDQSFEFLLRPERETVAWPSECVAEGVEFKRAVLGG
ncbi:MULTISPECIES: hypothetical protein [unclassified Brevundimonas]|uniref:hypothetical protein n=1 Tax=unclassified Brevundimonas TaxID=2622653 RepID=UPI003F8EC299